MQIMYNYVYYIYYVWYTPSPLAAARIHHRAPESLSSMRQQRPHMAYGGKGSNFLSLTQLQWFGNIKKPTFCENHVFFRMFFSAPLNFSKSMGLYRRYALYRLYKGENNNNNSKKIVNMFFSRKISAFSGCF